jgi:hypothetical protein
VACRYASSYFGGLANVGMGACSRDVVSEGVISEGMKCGPAMLANPLPASWRKRDLLGDASATLAKARAQVAPNVDS